MASAHEGDANNRIAGGTADMKKQFGGPLHLPELLRNALRKASALAISLPKRVHAQRGPLLSVMHLSSHRQSCACLLLELLSLLKAPCDFSPPPPL